ncbi:MAG TPA: 7-cyano-7-deazaguanine synthase QueC [Alphaproteobacteria bacterium]|nr:7-cyano-7-deazaguanine synthase QueC [Alphaproteobacteria bacterium]
MKALVLFSGGQDSAICLALALSRFDEVQTVGFDYGQRHRVELECRLTVRRKIAEAFPQWGSRLGDDHLLDLSVLSDVSETALTRDVEIKLQENGLPNTFVPGRNLLFFTLAAALAYRQSIMHLVGGMCETDFSGYPDCRADTLQALEKAINLGMDRSFIIETPLMQLDKAASWRLAQELGGEKLVEIIRTETHSCYKGERGEMHEWGHGCGVCPACELRAKGYATYRAA